MKKLSSLLLIILSLFSCFIFSACQDKYKNLEMSFLVDGEQVEELELIIDESKTQVYGSKNVELVFNGIASEDIGELEISTDPSKPSLVNISEYTIEDNVCRFKVTADKSGSSYLQAKHMSSNKTISINLNVQQKSKDVEIVKNNYVIDIPLVDINSRDIDASQIIKLLDDGSTDKIYFKLSGVLPSGVSLKTTTIGEETLITGFNVNNTVANYSSVKVYPVTYLDAEGYSPVPYTNKEINIIFLKPINNENMLISGANEDYIEIVKESLAGNKDIILIENDSTINEIEFNNYNSIQLQLNIKNDEIDELSEYLNYYDIEIKSSNDAVVLAHPYLIEDNKVVLQAKHYNENAQTITIGFIPKDKYVGQISSFSKSLTVKVDEKPRTIDIYQQSTNKLEKNADGYLIDIYNYYASSGNSLGALFNFEPVETYSRQDMHSMRLIVSNPQIFTELNVDLSDPVNTDVREDLGTNKYLLEIYKFNNPLVLTYDAELGLVSEPFTKSDNLYIKYIKNNSGEFTLDLTVQAVPEYNGEDADLLYLGKIKQNKVNIKFNRLEGVKDLEVNAGTFDGTTYVAYNDEGGVVYQVEKLHFDRTNLHLENGYYVLKLPVNGVIGENNEYIASTDLEINIVSDDGAHEIPWVQNVGITDYKNIDFSKNTKHIYNYTNSESVNNIIILDINSATPIGNYTINIKHGNGYEFTQIDGTTGVSCSIYQALTVEDISYKLELGNTDVYHADKLNEYDIDNRNPNYNPLVAGSKQYIYENYPADYIISTGHYVGLQVELTDEIINSKILDSFYFDFTIDGETAEIVTYDITNNIINFKFDIGSFIDDENKIINLEITVYSKQYENPITVSSEKDADSINITFFAYHFVADKDVELSDAPSVRYDYNSLGYFYKDLSSIDLGITADANLWNYVQNNESMGAVQIGNANKKVIWFANNNVANILTKYQTENSIRLQFNKWNGGEYVVDIYAQLIQFGRTITLRHRVSVKSPIITEHLIVNNKLTLNEDGSPYIDLKLGESITLDVDNYSQWGEVTNPEIVLLVINKDGKAIDNVLISGNTVTLENDTDISELDDLKLLIMAKDAIKAFVGVGEDGFYDLSKFLMASNDDAYVFIDLILTNGTRENRYIINTTKDFEDINKTNMIDKHYLLKSNIDLSTSNVVIDGFEGSILNESNFVVLGVTLDNSKPNLFKNFKGELIDLIFNVEYAYSNYETEDVTYNLGLIDNVSSNKIDFDYNLKTWEKEKSTLYYVDNSKIILNKDADYDNSKTYYRANIYNVSVNISGNSEFNSVKSTYFGGLVARNNGVILYNNTKIGTKGSIKVLGGNSVSFGGLVGYNLGYIDGGYASISSLVGGVEFVSIGDSGAIANVDVISSLSGSASAIGLVVGYNSGELKNTYVMGSITATYGNNIGGVIGKNASTLKSLSINYEDDGRITEINNENDYKIENIVSRVNINAVDSDNVGGIVGVDVAGYYRNIRYQIIAGASTHGIIAKDNVGGIAGSSQDGIFEYCSVMSYKWNYNLLADAVRDNFITADDNADIVGNNYVAGIVGATGSTDASIDKNANKKFTLVHYSSVNAYISGNDCVAGLMHRKTGVAVIHNAYFMGGVVASVSSNYISNENVMKSYTYYVCDNQINGKTHFEDLKSTMNLPVNNSWDQSNELNAGYIYIELDGQPIFEIAPTSLTVSVNEHYGPNANNSVAPRKINNDTIYFDYYKFNLDSSSPDFVALNNALNNKYNKHDLVNSYFDFAYTPAGIRVHLSVESTNSRILEIVNTHYVLVKGVGECELVFSSVLNPAIKSVVKVVVNYPMGDISLNSNHDHKFDHDTSVNLVEKIAKNKSIKYTVSSSGFKLFVFNNIQNSYTYQTNTEINWIVEVSCNIALADGIGKYINISGIEGVEEDSKLIFDVPFDLPLSVSVLEYLKNGKFSLEFTPYINIRYNNTIIYNDKYEDKNIGFKVTTAVGATDIALDLTEAIIYPNDKTELNGYIVTDIDLSEMDLETSIADNMLNNDVYKTSATISTDTQSERALAEIELKKYLTSIELGEFDADNNRQTFKFGIACPDEDYETKNYLNIQFKLSNDVQASVKFIILPERVDNIEVKSYIYGKNNDGTVNKDVILSSNVLRPSGHGLLIINPVPVDAYYDYLEIIDVTGSEEITFTQLKDTKGTILSTQDEVTTNGLGIKLKNKTGKTYYVATRISKSYSNKMHTIRTLAYVTTSSGRVCVGSSYFDIEVRMLPNIKVEYLKPNGESIINGGLSSTFAESNIETITASYMTGIVGDDNAGLENVTSYIANGVDTRFKIETAFSDGSVTAGYELYDTASRTAQQTDLFVLEKDGSANNNYTLKFKKGYDAGLNGKELILTVSTKIDNNGTIEIGSVKIRFKIVKYTIFDVSIKGTADSKRFELFGNVGVEKDLNFYFRPTDISVYNDDQVANTKNFWNKEYNYIANINDVNNLNTIDITINEILSKLNAPLYEADGVTVKNNSYFKLYDLSNGLHIDDDSKAKLVGNKLTVYDDEDLGLKVELPLTLYNNYWVVNNSKMKLTNVFTTRFTELNPDYSYDVVKNTEDFLSMESGGKYILGVDITLENYAPLDLNLVEFDGNGRTITINSFASFEEETIQVGLFKQIYQGMVVKNVIVKYQTDNENNLGRVETNNTDYNITYYDLCNNAEVNYTSAIFGGLTPVNKGVISNCKVEGKVAFKASVIEENHGSNGSNYDISFYMGGLVGNNESTGYITNSTSELGIFSLANIGGFAYSNAGKISSSNFNADDNKGTIFAYKSQDTDNSIRVRVAGFVVDNDGEISISNVEVGVTTVRSGNTISNLMTKNILAGFVYDNSGEIDNAYVNVNLIGTAQDIFSGFVYINTGKIDRSYTNIAGGHLYSSVNTFAPSGTAGISNCAEIRQAVISYTNGIDDLEVITYKIDVGTGAYIDDYRYSVASYDKIELAFGDNLNAVWLRPICSGDNPDTVAVEPNYNRLPKLVCVGFNLPKEFAKISSVEIVNSIADLEYEPGLNIGDIKTKTIELENVYNAHGEMNTEYAAGYKNVGGNNKIQIYYGMRTVVYYSYIKVEDGIESFRTAVMSENYGVKDNPITISSLAEWDYYFVSQSAKYNSDTIRNHFRVISDIDFSGISGNPLTSIKTLHSNIDGNNMALTGIRIYSEEGLSSIGLFANISGESSDAIVVKNLDIQAISVYAFKTRAVGLLAGVVENCKLYNIKVSYDDSVSNLIVVGGNATGGVAGLVKGKLNADNDTIGIDNIESNIGANSTSVRTGLEYNVYLSVNNETASNLQDVYYSGSIFGIVDAYGYKPDEYANMKNIYVNGDITSLGHTVGGAIGFNGEKVVADNVNVNITAGVLDGAQYSAGIIGENRGKLLKSSFVTENTGLFSLSDYVSAGAVGLNLGGLVDNVKVNVDIIKNNNSTDTVVGGIVGRDFEGCVSNCTFDGKLLAYITGGIIGGDYSAEYLSNHQSNPGALTQVCKEQLISYGATTTLKLSQDKTNDIKQNKVGVNALMYWFENRDLFYFYDEPINDQTPVQPSRRRVLGMIVGVTINYEDPAHINKYVLTYNDGLEVSKDVNDNRKNIYDILVDNGVEAGTEDDLLLFEGEDNKKQVYVIDNNPSEFTFDKAYVMYITGAYANSVDGWMGDAYTEEMIVFGGSAYYTEYREPVGS